MRILAYTVVGNEEEIIESFVRYNFNFVDKMIIVPTYCTDQTLPILRKLICEGYNIDLITDEMCRISFDQRLLDNKYLRIITEEENIDWIIPLDADEFLTGDSNPREIIELLDDSNVYEAKWINYAITRNYDKSERFIPKRLRYVKTNYVGNQYGKVIIPKKLLVNNRITLDTGHHSVSGIGITTKQIPSLRIAHYPTVSEEQYKLRIYEHSIKQLTWRNRGYTEAFHIYRQIERFETGGDIIDIANSYGLEAISEDKFEEKPLNLEYCSPDSTKIKYSEKDSVDFLFGLQSIGQLMAIKAYNLELDNYFDANKKTVLIYGVGESADSLFYGLPENIVNIRAYVDDDVDNKFRMYNKRIIIPTSYIYFFKYDKIILSNTHSGQEDRNYLISLGIKDECISGVEFLFDELEKKECL